MSERSPGTCKGLAASSGPASRVTAYLDAYQTGPGALPPGPAAGLTDLAGALGRMRVEHLPFTHATIDAFLPDEMYRAVLRDWPAEAGLAPVVLPGPGGAARDYVGSRTTKLLEDWGARGVGSPGTGTWKQVSLALRSPLFVRSLFACFSDIIDANLASLPGGPRGFPGFKLYLNCDQGADEALGAHVNALRKLLTIVIYIDLKGPLTGESPQLWGTTLYQAEPGSVTPVHFSPNAGHSAAQRISFAANRAFIMPNDSRALHGVAGGQDGVTRRALMCGYWLLSER